MAATSGSRTVPIGSIWRIGFSDTRPNMRAVGSPQRDAVQACADSCTLMANRNAIIWNRMSGSLDGIVRIDSNKAQCGCGPRASSYERTGFSKLAAYLCNLTCDFCNRYLLSRAHG